MVYFEELFETLIGPVGDYCFSLWWIVLSVVGVLNSLYLWRDIRITRWKTGKSRTKKVINYLRNRTPLGRIKKNVVDKHLEDRTKANSSNSTKSIEALEARAQADPNSLSPKQLDTIAEHAYPASAVDWRSKYYIRSRELALVYCGVCAYRALFPRQDVEKWCAIDHWLSWPFIGRTAATIAELCLIYQVELFDAEVMRRRYDIVANRKNPVRGWTKLAKLSDVMKTTVVPAAWLAEALSWTGILRREEIYNACEESLWAWMSLAMSIRCIDFLMHQNYGHPSTFINQMLLVVAAVFAYLVTCDVPMYLENYMSGANARPDGEVFDMKEAVLETMSCVKVTQTYEDWGPHMTWMFLYFTFGCWSSLCMTQAWTVFHVFPDRVYLSPIRVKLHHFFASSKAVAKEMQKEVDRATNGASSSGSAGGVGFPRRRNERARM